MDNPSTSTELTTPCVAQPLTGTEERLELLTHQALDVYEAALNSGNSLAQLTAAREVLHAWSRQPKRGQRVPLSLEQENAQIVAGFRNPDARLRGLMLEAGLPLPEKK